MDQERISLLESEATRLSVEARAHEETRARLEREIQSHKDRVRQAEANLQNALSEMTRWRSTATEAQARITALEGRVAVAPPPVPAGQGLGATEAFLDASGTLSQWCSVLSAERAEIGITCYTFDLEPLIDACITARGRDPARPHVVRIIADELEQRERSCSGHRA